MPHTNLSEPYKFSIPARSSEQPLSPFTTTTTTTKTSTATSPSTFSKTTRTGIPSSVSTPKNPAGISAEGLVTGRYGEDKFNNSNSNFGDINNKKPVKARFDQYKFEERKEESNSENTSINNSTRKLLARIDPKNDGLLTTSFRSSGRVQQPPSMSELESRENLRLPGTQISKNGRQVPKPVPLRYSVVPPPPMTELEFWGSLVQDYTKTAQCLPTLLSKKIRSGIPVPLRGIVWQSISGSGDAALEDSYDVLSKQTSPYETVIEKDVERSFPAVDMFRDPEGEGQRMLGRVLKSFSLHDENIGYCQGLTFVVGPLLMHMPEKQAFCVLVRFMVKYEMRSCFLPDLYGLNLRVYQYSQLLRQHVPNVVKHLDAFQIEPAYVAQWFLSFFAVSCPLPMLFRLYDILFTEGAPETLMRVALSLMQKNEAKILNCKEAENLIQLLFSKGLWDVYHYNADEFVNEFLSLDEIITHEILKSLEVKYREAQLSNSGVGSIKQSEKVGSAATKLLDRPRTRQNNISLKSSDSRSELITPSQTTELRRSSSKNSLASTLNSTGGAGSDSMFSSSTALTTVTRDSVNTNGGSISFQSINNNIHQAKDSNKVLHGQIQDLLATLNELQKENTELTTQLKTERDERHDDQDLVQSLLSKLRQDVRTKSIFKSREILKPSSLNNNDDYDDDDDDDDDGDSSGRGKVKNGISDKSTNHQSTDIREDPDNHLIYFLNIVESQFLPNNRISFSSSSPQRQSKVQIQEELARVKGKLETEISKTQEFDRQFFEQEKEIKSLQKQVREVHLHIRHSFNENQRLKGVIQDLRKEQQQAKNFDEVSQNSETHTGHSREYYGLSNNGIRKLKLGNESIKKMLPSGKLQCTNNNSLGIMANITLPTADKALSPILNPTIVVNAENKLDDEKESLVFKLVEAKTAEAMAREEADDLRNKLENLKKTMSQYSNGTTLKTAKENSSSSSSSPTRNLSMGFSGYFGKPKTETMTTADPMTESMAIDDSEIVVKDLDKINGNNLDNNNSSTVFSGFFSRPKVEAKPILNSEPKALNGESSSESIKELKKIENATTSNSLSIGFGGYFGKPKTETMTTADPMTESMTIDDSEIIVKDLDKINGNNSDNNSSSTVFSGFFSRPKVEAEPILNSEPKALNGDSSSESVKEIKKNENVISTNSLSIGFGGYFGKPKTETMTTADPMTESMTIDDSEIIVKDLDKINGNNSDNNSSSTVFSGFFSRPKVEAEPILNSEPKALNGESSSESIKELKKIENATTSNSLSMGLGGYFARPRADTKTPLNPAPTVVPNTERPVENKIIMSEKIDPVNTNDTSFTGLGYFSKLRVETKSPSSPAVSSPTNGGINKNTRNSDDKLNNFGTTTTSMGYSSYLARPRTENKTVSNPVPLAVTRSTEENTTDSEKTKITSISNSLSMGFGYFSKQKAETALPSNPAAPATATGDTKENTKESEKIRNSDPSNNLLSMGLGGYFSRPRAETKSNPNPAPTAVIGNTNETYGGLAKIPTGNTSSNLSLGAEAPVGNPVNDSITISNSSSALLSDIKPNSESVKNNDTSTGSSFSLAIGGYFSNSKAESKVTSNLKATAESKVTSNPKATAESTKNNNNNNTGNTGNSFSLGLGGYFGNSKAEPNKTTSNPLENPPPDPKSVTESTKNNNTSTGNSFSLGLGGYFGNSKAENKTPPKSEPAPTPANNNGTGFWGGWGKKS